MTLTMQKEMKNLRQEMHGIRSLLMELVDPDFGLELADTIKERIRRARKSGQFLSLQEAVHELQQ